VLLEYRTSATPVVAEDVLRRAGYDVRVCEGPGDTTGMCRLLEEGHCPLADGADAVYNAFGIDTTEHRNIIRALRRHHPDTPVIVETTRMRADEHLELLDGCVRADVRSTAASLVGTVATALCER
jgi:hypothetical protein